MTSLNHKKYHSIDLPSGFVRAFKDADIRGLYPSEVSPELAYRVMAVFVNEFKYREILIGRDMRVSSPAIYEAAVAGATAAGARVYNLGLIDTPQLYYASGKKQLPGLMITASHNPAEYNGLKLVFPGAVPVTGKTGLNLIRQTITHGIVESNKAGGVKHLDLNQEYLRYVTKLTPLPKLSRPLRILVDTGNGMGVAVTPALQEAGIEIEVINEKLDGLFPCRGSNPTLKVNQTLVRQAMASGDFDLGVAFDGDADRVTIFDEKGRALNSAETAAILAEEYVREQGSGLKMLYTPLVGRNYQTVIKRLPAQSVRARVGHAFIKETMRKHDVTFGAEHSGHFYFKDNYYADSGILTVRKFLQAVALKITEENRPLSEIIKPYQKYHQSDDTLAYVKDKKVALTESVIKLAKKYHAKTTKYDGVTLDFAETRIVIKQSVTEDALKYVVEAPTQKEVREVVRVVEEILSEYKV